MTKPDKNSLCFLWCVPRSRSTAFEKMMANLEQIDVVGEPFIDIYKHGIQSKASFQEARKNFDGVFETLLRNVQRRPVFVKDMAYHATEFISDKHILSANHTFLIRNPSHSIPSLYKMRNDFQENETGFEVQCKLFNRIVELTGKKPLILDAEILISSPRETVNSFFHHIEYPMPEDILNWHPGSREDWKERETWHIDAINSTGFIDVKAYVDIEKLPSRVKKIIQKNMPYYHFLREIILQQ